MLITSIHFFGGVALLIVGAEILVRGASRLAAALGITPVVIGLTVVAFGTSAPEAAVSIMAAVNPGGGADIAIGNVIGSNIFNILLILGVSAIITPLAVSHQFVRLDVPLMIGASLLVLLLSLDGAVGRLDGLLLFAGIVAYTVFAIMKGRTSGTQSEMNQPISARPPSDRLFLFILLIVGGLALLVIGSQWLVKAATTIARTLGVSDLIIGLTIVAGGTSLPEVATSITASLRGEREIAVGNVVGSNLFNLLAVLGLSALVAPGGIPVAASVLSFDMPVMLGVSIACMPVFFTGFAIARWEGMLFLGYYLAYTLFLFLFATGYQQTRMLGDIMLWVVIPLTALTLLLPVVIQLRRKR